MTPDADTPAARIARHIERNATDSPAWALAWATLQSAQWAERAAVAMERFVAALERAAAEDGR